MNPQTHCSYRLCALGAAVLNQSVGVGRSFVVEGAASGGLTTVIQWRLMQGHSHRFDLAGGSDGAEQKVHFQPSLRAV